MSGTEQSGVPVETRECPYCDWEVEKEIITEMDRHDLDDRAERHYEHVHCGKVRVQVTLEAEWALHPDQDIQEMGVAALERFEEEPIPGFEAAYSSVETIEECDVDTGTEQEVDR